MIDLIIGVLDPQGLYVFDGILLQRVVECSCALTVVLIVCLLWAIFKVLSAFMR